MTATGAGLRRHIQTCVRRRGAVRLNNEFYAELDDYSIQDWLVAFEARNNLARILKALNSGDTTHDWSVAFNLEFHHMCVYTVERLVPMRGQSSLPHEMNYYTTFLHAESATTAIQTLNYQLLASTLDGEGRYHPDRIEHALKKLEESDLAVLAMDRALVATAMSLALNPQSEVSAPYLSVDLSYDNETIKEQFATWLQNARYKYKTKPSVTARETTINKTMSKWREYKVLQYMDINLMAHFKDKPLGRQLAAAIVMPEKLYTEGSVRKTVESRIKNQCEPVVQEFLGGK